MKKLSEQEVWLRAWCATADKSSMKEVPAEWADRCLEQFKKRFKEPKQ